MSPRSRSFAVAPAAAVALLGLTIAQARADEASAAAGGGKHSLFSPAPLTGTISTERPSFSVGADAVPAGHVQFESGYLYSSDSADKTQTFPNLQVRVGLLDGVEGWLLTDGYVQSDTGEDGLTGVRAGAKFEVLHQEQDGLSLAIQPSLGIPGGDVPGGGKFDPRVEVAAEYKLTDDVRLLANVSAAGVTDEAGRQTAEFATSLLASYSPAKRLGLFVEYFAIYSDVDVATHNADVGATYLLNDNTQIDVVFGTGLNSHATDFFVGAGYSFRF